MLLLLVIAMSTGTDDAAHLVSWKDESVATNERCVWGKAYLLVNEGGFGNFRIKAKDGKKMWVFRIPKQWRHHKRIYVTFSPVGLNGDNTYVRFWNPDDPEDMRNLRKGRYFNNHKVYWWRENNP